MWRTKFEFQKQATATSATATDEPGPNKGKGKSQSKSRGDSSDLTDKEILDDWMISMIKTMRADMDNDKLVPPGVVYIMVRVYSEKTGVHTFRLMVLYTTHTNTHMLRFTTQMLDPPSPRPSNCKGSQNPAETRNTTTSFSLRNPTIGPPRHRGTIGYRTKLRIGWYFGSAIPSRRGLESVSGDFGFLTRDRAMLWVPDPGETRWRDGEIGADAAWVFGPGFWVKRRQTGFD